MVAKIEVPKTMSSLEQDPIFLPRFNHTSLTFSISESLIFIVQITVPGREAQISVDKGIKIQEGNC